MRVGRCSPKLGRVLPGLVDALVDGSPGLQSFDHPKADDLSSHEIFPQCNRGFNGVPDRINALLASVLHGAVVVQTVLVLVDLACSREAGGARVYHAD